jgi:hypothetical protein
LKIGVCNLDLFRKMKMVDLQVLAVCPDDA